MMMTSVETISEEELRRISDEIYRDRFAIYDFNPDAGRKDAVLWMLLGCLISRLSITDEELQGVEGSYEEAITELLRERTESGLDARSVVAELVKRVENESDEEGLD